MAKQVMTQEEQFAKLQEAIDTRKGTKGALMPILHEAQHLFGAVPLNVQKVISKELSIPLAEIYGVVTFYSQFTLEPDGEFVIVVCMGTACFVRGADRITESLKEKLGIGSNETTEDGLFTLKDVRCIGACGLAPVVMVDEKVYGRVKEEDIDEILNQYRG